MYYQSLILPQDYFGAGIPLFGCSTLLPFLCIHMRKRRKEYVLRECKISLGNQKQSLRHVVEHMWCFGLACWHIIGWFNLLCTITCWLTVVRFMSMSIFCMYRSNNGSPTNSAFWFALACVKMNLFVHITFWGLDYDILGQQNNSFSFDE